VDFVESGISRVDAQAQEVELADGERADDYLIIASGTQADPTLVPGLADGPLFRDKVHEFYTLEGSVAEEVFREPASEPRLGPTAAQGDTEMTTITHIPPGFIMPDFGTAGRARPPATATPGEEGATSAVSSYTGPRDMAFICSKGNLDMAYPALIMGNAAQGEGVEVHIFFTFWGLDMVNTKTYENLKSTLSGNTARHMPGLGRVRPGLEHRSKPQALRNVPCMTGITTTMMKKQMADLEIPDIPEFLDLMQAAGAHMYACNLSFDMANMIEAERHPAVEGVSAGDFIEIAEDAQVVLV
jgi:peroxiredoxin family protein